MPTTKKRADGKIDRMMEKASRALEETRYFECEHLCVEAMELAHSTQDYERMGRIALPLQEARRQKRLAALDTKRLVMLDEPILEEEPLDPGCYLLQPPLVGADGRDLRERADEQEIPVFAIVREPKTRTGLWPIVMIGPVTVRARVKPPADESKPDIGWFIAAAEALGDAALADINTEISSVQRVDEVYDRLCTVVDHEKLHQALEEICRVATEEVASGKVEARVRAKRKTRSRRQRRLASEEEE